MGRILVFINPDSYLIKSGHAKNGTINGQCPICDVESKKVSNQNLWANPLDHIVKDIMVSIEQVRRALIGYSKGDLQIPVEYESKNELGEMCDAIRRSQLILGAVIHDTSNLLSEMAAGNFDVKSQDEKLYVGELTTMFRSIREINHQLSDTLAHITLSADQVAAGSEQIANGAQSLAQGTTEQASAIQELSATFAEISNSAKKNAQGSAGAMEKTEYASSQLEESKKYMDDMVIAMKKISESSGEIAIS